MVGHRTYIAFYVGSTRGLRACSSGQVHSKEQKQVSLLRDDTACRSACGCVELQGRPQWPLRQRQWMDVCVVSATDARMSRAVRVSHSSGSLESLVKRKKASRRVHPCSQRGADHSHAHPSHYRGALGHGVFSRLQVHQ